MSNMGKIHVAILFWDWGIGGVQTRFNDVIDQLSLKNNTSPITVLLKRDLGIRKIPKQSKSEVIFFSKDVGVGKQKSFFIWLLKQLQNKKSTHVVAILNRFALVAVIYKIVALLQGRQCRVIINQPTFTSLYLRQYEKWYWKYLVIFFYRFADTIIVPTQVMKTDLTDNFYLQEEKIIVIPSWVKQQESSKKSVKKYDLLFIGRLSPEKRVDTFLDIVLKAKREEFPLKACIAGDGELKSWVEEMIKKNNLQTMVDFVGFSGKVNKLLEQSRLLILPSENEGLPMVVLEAYSKKVPVVVAAFPGATEVVVDDITGLVITNRADFYPKVCTLLKNKKKLEFLSKNALEFGQENFSVKNLMSFTEHILGVHSN